MTTLNDSIFEIFPDVIQSNARFSMTDRLEVHLDHVRMPAGNGKLAKKTKERSLDVMSAIKKGIVVKTEVLCYGHALIIAMNRVNGDPKYALYRQGKCMKKSVEVLLETSGVDLSNGGGVEELEVSEVPFGVQNCLMV